MSLENEIKNLTAAVVALTERIGQLEAPKVESPKKEAVKVEKPKKEKVKTTETTPSDDTITAESLQALCMTIVKADRSKGAAIKEMLNELNGAKTIKDVNPDQYAVLKESLEGLLNE